VSGVETRPYDVLVVGAGAAGLRAAIEAAELGARTAVVCKSLLGKAATVMDTDGFSAVSDDASASDHWREHCVDTLIGGKLVGDWRMARIHAQEAPARLLELESWGAVFDRTDDGGIARLPASGHRHSRVAQAAGRAGLEALRALQARAVRMGIDIHMECAILHVMTRVGSACAALGYRKSSGDALLFPAAAVVIATGGSSRAWGEAGAPADSSGDGAALALDAGAELIDMEFAGSGGIRVDAESTATAVRGLFAAGDAAAGLHGNGAICGNGLSAALVFGRRAGAQAASHAAGAARQAPDGRELERLARAMNEPLQRRSGANPYVLCRGLQECMSDIVANARGAADLQEALARVRRFGRRSENAVVRGPRQYNPGWHLVHELRSMLVLSEAVILSALARAEGTDGQNLIVRYTQGSLAVHRIRHPALPADLQGLIERRDGWQRVKPGSGSGVAMPAVAGSGNMR